ncbi:MAG TPA: T9SS type A sorting domain-containing protein [Ignavibacteriaceae bacterium]|nr:T9SS type A sorting domain-containing protein [Ignavibacteriaceae bacterium]
MFLYPQTTITSKAIKAKCAEKVDVIRNESKDLNYNAKASPLESQGFEKMLYVSINTNDENKNKLLESTDLSIPTSFFLSQNYPNPFNPMTKISFGIAHSGFVQLKLFNLQGKEMRTLINSNLPPGVHEISFDGSDLTSGVYVYRLVMENYTDTKRMTLIK